MTVEHVQCTEFKRKIYIRAERFSLVTGFNAFADNQSHQSELLFQAKYKSQQIGRLYQKWLNPFYNVFKNKTKI